MRFLLWNQVRGKNNYDLMSNDGRKCLFICHSQWWLMTLQGCLCGRLINPIWTRRPLPDIGQTLAGHLPLVSHRLATHSFCNMLATCWPWVYNGCHWWEVVPRLLHVLSSHIFPVIVSIYDMCTNVELTYVTVQITIESICLRW